jgi:hypothetical protein
MKEFFSMIWGFLGFGWDITAFAVKNPGWAIVIGLVIAILALWLGKKILTLPLSLAWRGIKSVGRKVPGAVASGARRVPGLASKAKDAAVAEARRLPQARQLITGSRRNFAIVGVVAALLIIGALYWSLSGTKPAPPVQTAKEWVDKAREYLPPWLGGKPPGAPSTPSGPGGTMPPIDIWQFQPKPKPEPRGFDLTDQAKKGLGEIQQGVRSGEISKSVEESGKKAIERGKNLLKPKETDAERQTREMKERVELQRDRQEMEEALENLKRDASEAQR